MDVKCLWYRGIGEYNFSTDCGNTYFPYVKGFTQPKIVTDDAGTQICPWCGKVINYEDHSEDEDEDG